MTKQPETHEKAAFDPHARFVDREGYEYDSWFDWFGEKDPSDSRRNREFQAERLVWGERAAQSWVKRYEELFAQYGSPEIVFDLLERDRHDPSRDPLFAF